MFVCLIPLANIEDALRGVKMNLYTVKSFARSLKLGSKFVYQTVPRLLTIWLDLGEDQILSSTDTFKRINDICAKSVKEAPVFKVSFEGT
jgi:serine/threonine-protein kinase ATR